MLWIEAVSRSKWWLEQVMIFKTWDARIKGAMGTFERDFPCTTAEYGMGGYSSYSNGIVNCITACWDLRNEKKTIKMKGHLELYSCLSLHRKFTE